MNELTEYFFIPTTLILLEEADEESHLFVSLSVLRVGFPYLSSGYVKDRFVFTRLLFGLFITRNAEDRISFVVAHRPKKLYGVQSVLVGRGVTLGAKAQRILSLDSFQLFGKSIILLFTQNAVRSSLGGQEQIVSIEFWEVIDA